jgi:hypothetical protein
MKINDLGLNEIKRQAAKFGNGRDVNEALDQPYPVRWSVKKDTQWYGHAKEDDFYNQMGIEIKSISEGRWSIRFNVGDKMDKTGEGDQFKIFATVKAAIQEWWNWASKNAQVDQITFSADKILDNSRSKLYNRFAKQFANAINYNVEVVSGRASDIFYLKKPGFKESTNEGGISKKVKEQSTSVLFNLGLVESVMVQLERGPTYDILHVKQKGKNRVEIRGKKGYDSYGYDPTDKLHQVLDKLGKAANISELMNGDPVVLNPGHPDGPKAIDTVKKEDAPRYTAAEWSIIEGGHSSEDTVIQEKVKLFNFDKY